MAEPPGRLRSCPECGTRTRQRVCPRDGLPTIGAAHLDTAATRISGSVIDGRFRIGDLIAAGAMGEVYRARSTDHRAEVAIKLLKSEHTRDQRAVLRFFREARIASKMTGPNFVHIHELGFDDVVGRPFIVMERLAGTTLAALAPLPPRRAARVLAQVAEAIDTAYALGVVHRDLKPANVIIIDEDGGTRVVVSDFGVAKDHEADDNTLTRTGEPLGTPSSMAPEQIEGREVDARTDLYALGCLLHRVLTGERVFGASEIKVLLQQHLLEAPPPLPAQLPGGERTPVPLILLRDALLAKRPADRPASASDVARVLEQVGSGDDDGALTTLARLGIERLDARDGDETWDPGAPVTRDRPTAEDARRVRRRVWIAALLALATVAGLVLGLGPKGSEPPPVSVVRASALRTLPTLGGPTIERRTEPPAVPEVAPRAEPEPELVTVAIESRPIAWVYRAGERLGPTPYALQLAADAAPVEVELRQAGYARQRLSVKPDDPSPRMVSLERLPERPSAEEPSEWRPKPF